ncbi:MAG: chloride channel protein [Proteobacteria bacterium]|nr:chloride channel protein [Pseudomonadota bacterium]
MQQKTPLDATPMDNVAKPSEQVPDPSNSPVDLISRARLHGGEALRGARAFGRLERMRFRRLLRDDSAALLLASLFAGAAGGAIASVMVAVANHLHSFLFGLADDVRLSAANDVDPLRVIAFVTIGGLLLGMLTTFWPKRSGSIVDPIEANALHGGRMSLTDSLFVAVQTIASSGFGASLGLEGGFTQLSGAVGSKLGTTMRRRRAHVRMLVAAGAAGAIAGGFGAPFAGAAYGFELILGSYTVVSLAPIVIGAVAGSFASGSLLGEGYQVMLPALHFAGSGQFLLLIAIGAISGLIGVLLMLGVTTTERVFLKTKLEAGMRPVVGGAAVAMLGIITPHALGSGHGGVEDILRSNWSISAIGLVLVAKLLSSAISIGSGFRGGLFSTSLFLGALIGAAAAALGGAIGIVPAADAPLFTIVGMASFAAAVIGAPMTMALLAIEMTNSLSIASPVLIGIVVAGITVRRVFGYSFSTWRFHLRGEAIVGGGDIGWVRDVTAGSLMRRDLATVAETTGADRIRAEFPLGSRKYVAVKDGAGRYLGIVDLALMHADDDRDADLDKYIEHRDDMVAVSSPIDVVLRFFEKSESEILVVVDNLESRRVRGMLTEAFVLRRYRQELEARQRELFG